MANEAADSVAREWLNDSIVVIGRVQKDKDGRPRLMRVIKLRSKGQKEGGPNKWRLNFKTNDNF